jgi:hypothetical protein
MGYFLPYQIVQPHPVGGLPGMKRLISLTEAHDLPGQLPQVITNSYVDDIMIFAHDPLRYLESPPASGRIDKNVGPPEPRPSLIHGRLKSSIRPDGSWEFNNYIISPGNPVSIFEHYSGWNDVPITQKKSARKTVTTVSASGSTTENYVATKLISKSRTTLSGGATAPITTAQQWEGGDVWHVTTTGYYPDSPVGINSGRIMWIEKSDGTASTYSYANVNGKLVMTTRSGAGSRSAVTAGTETKITYRVGNIPVAVTNKDIASNLSIGEWITDETYNSGFDAMGRPIKRIHNGDPDDFDITQYACCGLEESRSRDGSITK